MIAGNGSRRFGKGGKPRERDERERKTKVWSVFFGGGVLKSDNSGPEYTRRDERVTYK